MNRIIKFRAWDKKRKLMIGIDYPDNWDNNRDEWYQDVNKMCLTGIEEINEDNNIELMQFTGVYDNSGKPIYEGDIVKCHDHLTEIESGTYVVEYKGSSFFAGNLALSDWGSVWIEVIGNIYENPEL